MKIGIIGAGMIGSNLAGLLAGTGHTVKLANSRGPASIGDLADRIGTTATTLADAVLGVGAIIVSIPQDAVARLPADLFDAVPGTVAIVDTGNYYPGLRDRTIEEIEAGLAESAWVAKMIGRPVIKAFNSISFTSLRDGGRPAGAPGRIALPVAGDDAPAKAIVVGLVDQIGFDAVDAGSIEDSWRQQPGTPTYCTDLDRAGVAQALTLADRTRAPVLRDAFIAEMLRIRREGGSADLIALGRSIYGAP
jgi:predicted dinucleotide-binding enzyme